MTEVVLASITRLYCSVHSTFYTCCVADWVDISLTGAVRGGFDDCRRRTSTATLFFAKVQPVTDNSVLQVVILASNGDCDDVQKVVTHSDVGGHCRYGRPGSPWVANRPRIVHSLLDAVNTFHFKQKRRVKQWIHFVTRRTQAVSPSVKITKRTVLLTGPPTHSVGRPVLFRCLASDVVCRLSSSVTLHGGAT